MIPGRATLSAPIRERGDSRALPLQRAARARIDVGLGIEIGFRLMGWAAVTALVVAGLFVAAFAMLGNFSLEGFFMQVANLADRYGAADGARRAAFHKQLWSIALILFVMVMFFRRGSLARTCINDGEK